MFKNLFALLLFIFVAESAKEKYHYVHVPLVGRYIKLHRIPANWREAKLRCQLEDAVLASPDSKNMLTAMSEMMVNRQVSKVYTGIHATFSKGDYTTITGTPLSNLDVEWAQYDPYNFDNFEDCLIMNSSGELADTKCTNAYPFICYKSPEKMDAHSCRYSQNGVTRSDYVLYNKTLSCYKFHKEARFWSDAFRTCQAEDAYLAIINSEDESQFLKTLFEQNPPNTLCGQMSGDFFKESASIGFRRSDEDQESFVTIHGQSLSDAGFTKFRAGEPNNTDNNESCGSVWKTGLLNSHNCHERIAFICEKPLVNSHSCSDPPDDNSDYILSNKTKSCYKFHTDALFWADAYKACEAEDAHLAIINSNTESQVFKELFDQNLPKNKTFDFYTESVSIGFRRSSDNYNVFVTIDGQSLSEAGFNRFESGEPSNFFAQKKEPCGSIKRNGLLNDYDYDTPLAFICEKPLVTKVNLQTGSDYF